MNDPDEQTDEPEYLFDGSEIVLPEQQPDDESTDH